MQTLRGVINTIRAPLVPVNCMRLGIWSRWCSGSGKFRQKSRIIGVDEQQVLAQAEVEFELREMEGHATNVHYFGGVQFNRSGSNTLRFFPETKCARAFPCRWAGRTLSSPKYSRENSRMNDCQGGGRWFTT